MKEKITIYGYRDTRLIDNSLSRDDKDYHEFHLMLKEGANFTIIDQRGHLNPHVKTYRGTFEISGDKLLLKFKELSYKSEIKTLSNEAEIITEKLDEVRTYRIEECRLVSDNNTVLDFVSGNSLSKR